MPPFKHGGMPPSMPPSMRSQGCGAFGCGGRQPSVPPDRADIREIASRLTAPVRLSSGPPQPISRSHRAGRPHRARFRRRRYYVTAISGLFSTSFLLALISTQVLRDGREGGRRRGEGGIDRDRRSHHRDQRRGGLGLGLGSTLLHGRHVTPASKSGQVRKRARGGRPARCERLIG